MPYEGGFLTPWFFDGPVRRFCERGVRVGGHALQETVRGLTPVDTGELRESIHTTEMTIRPARRWGHLAKAYEVGVETDVEYAPYVEYGTGIYGPLAAPYEIRPKNPHGWLRWIDPKTGNPVFAKRVMHPGSPAAHMFENGAGAVEAVTERILSPFLNEWAREQERSNPWAH